MKDTTIIKFENENINVKGIYVCKKGFIKVHLNKQFYILKMDESIDNKIHVNKFKQYIFKLLCVDVKIQDYNLTCSIHITY